MSLWLRSDPLPVLEVPYFRLDGETYEATPSLKFIFAKENDGYLAEGPFDIIIHHDDFYELVAEYIPEILGFLWTTFAMDDDAKLTARAILLKRDLRERFGHIKQVPETLTLTSGNVDYTQSLSPSVTQSDGSYTLDLVDQILGDATERA